MHSQINRTATTFVCTGIEKLGTSHQQLENLATNRNMQPDSRRILHRLKIWIALPMQPEGIKSFYHNHQPKRLQQLRAK